MQMLYNSRSCRLLSSQGVFFLSFACAIIIMLQHLRSTDALDPSSLFFNVTRAHERRYTSFRIKEADAFMVRAAKSEERVHAGKDPTFCVGIVTVQRNDTDYFTTLMGSLLHGLSEQERSDMMLMPFIANVNPHAHWAFGETWLQDLADDIVTYETVPAAEKTRLSTLETAEGHREKALYNYTYLLEKCSESGAPYTLMLEDDVLAVESWYRRSRAAVKELMERPEYEKSIYLRLFYNTRLQGWNSESWPSYLFWSIIFELFVFSMLLILRRTSLIASKFLTTRTTATILIVCAPACVALYSPLEDSKCSHFHWVYIR
jgi:hypothetical protein